MGDTWPALPYDEWRETCETLHMWTQIMGKVKLKLSPFLNEYWNVALHFTARGMTTGLIPYQDRAFEVRFDFIDHNLFLETSDGATKTLSLIPRTVADFYGDFMDMLKAVGIHVAIDPMPSEVPNPISFDADRVHSSYDAGYVSRWWQIQVQTENVLQRFRSLFAGKSSPIQFFWGGFDLSHTRFSGRPAPVPHWAPRFYQLAEDQENYACGFWPGNPTYSGTILGAPAFYAYIYPEPDNFKRASFRPDAAHYDTQFGECILLYEDLRNTEKPAEALLDFFQSTYEVAATLAHWDREALERRPLQAVQS